MRILFKYEDIQTFNLLFWILILKKNITINIEWIFVGAEQLWTSFWENGV